MPAKNMAELDVSNAHSASRRVQLGDDEHYEIARSPSARVAAASAPPRSPLLKKFSPEQDRSVNAVLLEALQLADLSAVELAAMDKAAKRLCDAVHGLALLVDQRVTLVGPESSEDRSRVRSDIDELSKNLQTSHALLERTCAQMKKALGAGKNQLLAHKRKLVGRVVDEQTDSDCPSSGQSKKTTAARQASASSPALATPYALDLDAPRSAHLQAPSPARSPVFSASKSPTKVSFAAILMSECDQNDRGVAPQVSPELFASVTASVGLGELEFLDGKALERFMHELLTYSIARSSTLTFMGKAHHRKRIAQYAAELARLVLVDLGALPQVSL